MPRYTCFYFQVGVASCSFTFQMSIPKRMKADGLWDLEELLWQLSLCFVVWSGLQHWCPLPGLLPDCSRLCNRKLPWLCLGERKGSSCFPVKEALQGFWLVGSYWLSLVHLNVLEALEWDFEGVLDSHSPFSGITFSGITDRCLLQSSCLASTVSWQMDICQPRQPWQSELWTASCWP